MTEKPERTRRLLYGRRKGPRLSAHQTDLRQTLLPLLVYDAGKALFSQFPNSVQDIWLEVGFGAGEHLHSLAKENPSIGFIGAEPYETGVAKLLTKLDNFPLNNVRIYEGDGRDIIEAHQGKIRVESAVGRGTAFILKLPVARQAILSTPTLPIGIPGAEARGPLPDAGSFPTP